MKQYIGIVSAMLVAVLLCAGPAMGSTLFVSGAGTISGYAYEAEATFDLNEATNVLTVTLVNTATQDILMPAEVLTGMLFDITNAALLTRVSANVLDWSSSDSNIAYWTGSGDGTYNSTGDVGCEWAYNANGISSSGLGLYGPGDRFDTAHNLFGPADPDGLQYGILSQDDNLATGNTGVTKAPLIIGGVVFTFNASDLFSLADISNFSFQYGTALTEPNIPETPPVPEPASMALLGIGLAALVLKKRQSI